MSLYDRIFCEAEEKHPRLSPKAMQAFTHSFNSGNFGTQRFGQAFMNKHGSSLSIPHQHQLWEKDRKSAEAHIWQNHVG